MNKERTRLLQWFFPAAILLVAIAGIALWPRSARQVNTPPEAKPPVAARPALAPPQSPAVKAAPAVQAAAAPASAAPTTAATVPPPPTFPGEKTGKPWLDIPEWKLLTPRERIVRLMQQPFGIEHSGSVRALELAKDELYYRHVENPKARVTTIPAQATAEGVLREAEAVKAASGHLPRLVLYPVGTLREERTDKNRLTISEQVLMEAADENTAVASAKQVGLADAAPMSAAPGFVLGNDHRFPGSAIVAAAELDTAQGVKTSRPMLAYQSAKKSLPADPLFPRQWHLLKSGTAKVDINVANVWDNGHGARLKGSGIKVAVVDDGLQVSHPDLMANIPDLSTNLHRNWNGVPGTGVKPGDVYDPTPYAEPGGKDSAHGTACAGLIGAVENTLGGVGVAPLATLLGYRLIDGAYTQAEYAEAMGRDNDKIHIKSNSWGPADEANTIGYLDPVVKAAAENAATNGRGGLGVIMPWAAGNGRDKGDQTSHDEDANNIHRIPVGCLQRTGFPASYSEFGACLIVSSPGDFVYTTDNTGVDTGYNRDFHLTCPVISISSKTVTVTDVGDVVPGMQIVGPALAPGTLVASISGKILTLSKATVAAGTNVALLAYQNLRLTLSGARVTQGNTTVTVTSTAGVLPGAPIVGTGFAVNTIVSSVVNATTLILDKVPVNSVANTTLTVDQGLDGDYTDDFHGTSAATPIVAGVVALMLEANPTLSWRDVDEILLRTSQQVNPTDAPAPWGGWVTRDGGQPSIPFLIKHHHSYGGGCVDAEAAVSLARQWTALPARTAPLTKDSGTIALPIPDNKPTAGLVQTFDFSADPAMRVEQVEVTIKLAHTHRGDLQIELKSPSGVISLLKVPEVNNDNNNQGYNDFVFTSNRHWGESSLGNWTVTFKDVGKDDTGTLKHVAVKLHGVETASVQFTTVGAPQPEVFTAGTTQQIRVDVTGGGEISYTWFKGSGLSDAGYTEIAAARGSDTLDLPAVSVGDAGYYKVEVRNATAKITAPFWIGVLSSAPANVLVQPAKTLTLSAKVTLPTGKKATHFGWYKDAVTMVDGGNIKGVNTATLTVTNCIATDAGAYDVGIEVDNTYPGVSAISNVTIGKVSDIQLSAFPSGLIVSGAITPIDLNIANGSTKVVITGLPLGLTYNTVTGLITDTPTESVTNRIVKITATNAAGTSTKTLQMTVAPLPPNVVGSFFGNIERADGAYNGSAHGGNFGITVTSTGSFTCGVQFHGEQSKITGSIRAQVGQDPTVQIGVPITELLGSGPIKTLKPPYTSKGTLSLSIARTAGGSLTGSFTAVGSPTAVPLHGWRCTPNASLGARQNFYFEPTSAPAPGAAPEGSCAGSLNITGTGWASVIVWFPDGSIGTDGVCVGPNGEVALHLPCHTVGYNDQYALSKSGYSGSLMADLVITPQTSPQFDLVQGSATYIKNVPTVVDGQGYSRTGLDKYYPGGFDFGYTNLNRLVATGSEWRTTPGTALWGPGATIQAKFLFSGSDIDRSDVFKGWPSKCEPTVTLTGANNLLGQPIVVSPGVNPLFSYTYNAATGEVGGGFKPYRDPGRSGFVVDTSRTAIFKGVISLAHQRARGYVYMEPPGLNPRQTRASIFELKAP